MIYWLLVLNFICVLINVISNTYLAQVAAFSKISGLIVFLRFMRESRKFRGTV